MIQLENMSIVLNSHPDGELALENFRIEKSPIKKLHQGEFLVQNQWLSIDPYIRPRLNKVTPYAVSINIGEVIQGDTIGKVIASENQDFQMGDLVSTFSGWQKYYVVNEKSFFVRKIPPTSLSPTIFLSVVGTTGRSAYFGLNKIGKPKTGETLVVSAAAGAVGSVVGQLAKLANCRVVGLAGSDMKCRYVVDELGFDVCLNYKNSNLSKSLRDACPDGIDIYFENVGGRVSLQVAKYLNEGARIPICGSIANYNNGTIVDASAPAEFFSSLPDAPYNRFFLVTEWMRSYPESDSFLLDAVEKNIIKYRETILDGLESAPQSLMDQLIGKHLGKLLIRL